MGGAVRGPGQDRATGRGVTAIVGLREPRIASVNVDRHGQNALSCVGRHDGGDGTQWRRRSSRREVTVGLPNPLMGAPTAYCATAPPRPSKPSRLGGIDDQPEAPGVTGRAMVCVTGGEHDALPDCPGLKTARCSTRRWRNQRSRLGTGQRKARISAVRTLLATTTPFALGSTMRCRSLEIDRGPTAAKPVEPAG